jgi:hypothetical protein
MPRVYPNSGKTCFGPNCTRPATRRGMCTGHYGQRRLGKSLTPITRIFLRWETPKRYSANWSLEKKYGINLFDLEELKKKQNGICPISFLSLTKTPCVDHIGTKGKSDFVIRGALIRQANIMLGCLESLERLGADLKTIAAPHVYDYIMRARYVQKTMEAAA